MRKKSSHRSRRGKQSHRRGHRAELLCCLALWFKGYRILTRRYKTHQGEIDIVARKGKVLAFIEVKARPDMSKAAEAVNPFQQARMARTAALYHAHNRGLSKLQMRFDVMLVLPWRWPTHIENAFEARG